MDEQIISFIDGIKSDKQIHLLDEASTKQAIVLRALFLLGWNIFNVDEVKLNSPDEIPSVDYALILNKDRKVFITVKKPGESLDAFHQERIGYAAGGGAPFFILTNGIIWWFYLSSYSKKIGNGRFCSLDFLKQSSEEIAEQLTDFLNKDNISNGTSLKTAEKFIRSMQQKAAQEAIPEAWAAIMSKPHDILVKLISETIEKKCGFCAEKDAIVNFLTDWSLNRGQLSEMPTSRNPVRSLPEPDKPAQKNYDGRPVSSFSLKGIVYKIKSWDEVLVKICEILKSEYNREIENLQWHSVGRKYYFSKNQNELRFPKSIADTNIFVETYLTPNETVKASLSVLSAFGFRSSDLLIS